MQIYAYKYTEKYVKEKGKKKINPQPFLLKLSSGFYPHRAGPESLPFSRPLVPQSGSCPDTSSLTPPNSNCPKPPKLTSEEAKPSQRRTEPHPLPRLAGPQGMLDMNPPPSPPRWREKLLLPHFRVQRASPPLTPRLCGLRHLTCPCHLTASYLNQEQVWPKGVSRGWMAAPIGISSSVWEGHFSRCR